MAVELDLNDVVDEIILLNRVVVVFGPKEAIEVDVVDDESFFVSFKPENVVELFDVIDELTDVVVGLKKVVKLIVADVVVDEPVIDD